MTQPARTSNWQPPAGGLTTAVGPFTYTITFALLVDLLIALVLLPQDNTRTLMVGVTIFGSRYNRDVPIAMAGMLMASIPMILAYLFGQRYFIQGLVAGAVKG